MTIQQTLIIPRATRHLTVELPQDIPAGTVDMVLSFPAPAVSPPSAEFDEESLNLHPDPELVQKVKKEVSGLNFSPCFSSLEDVLAEADSRAQAEEADPSLRSLKKWHGIWENSKTWGKDIDVTAEIRKMRDEWEDNSRNE
jgi:hypothetical protein